MTTNNDIILWLAASRFTNDELREFFIWSSKQPASYIEKMFAQLRNNIYSPPKSEKVADTQRSIKSTAENDRISEHMQMIKEVEKLLLNDAKLSKAEATRIIIWELREAETAYGYLSSPNKISFRSWLARIGEDVSDSRVLHIAAKVRNALVHGSRSPSDWPI